MSTSAFHLFINLPLELQMQVWEHAFSAEDPYSFRGQLRNFVGHGHPRQLFKSPYSTKQVYYNNGGMKCGLIMTVCRVARLVALRVWRRMVERAEVLDTPHSYARTAKKKRVLRIFGALIDEVKDKLEEKEVVEDKKQEQDKQITGGAMGGVEDACTRG